MNAISDSPFPLTVSGRLRRLLAISLLAGSVGTGCSGESAQKAIYPVDPADLTSIEPTAVKRQSVPNCWLYTTAAWAESLHKRATGESVDLSESYWSFWRWFRQIQGLPAGGRLNATGMIDASGSYLEAAELIQEYGFMYEGDFLPEEAALARSQRQQQARAAVNLSLRTGALASAEARAQPAVVFAELSKAFGLSADVVADLTATFGVEGRALTASPPSGRIRAPQSLVVDRDVDTPVSLLDVVGISAAPAAYLQRRGRYAWVWLSYEAGDSEEANVHNQPLLRRMQRTLNDGKPMYLSWSADDSFADANGHYRAISTGTDSPIPYGHASLIFDDEVEDVPGFGTLRAGQQETRAEALAATLGDQARITFLRVKNPWAGTYEASGGRLAASQEGMGINDIDLAYLAAFPVGGDARRRFHGLAMPPESSTTPP